MLIIGCDYHPGFQQIAFVDTETGELGERRLSHREEAEQFYGTLKERSVLRQQWKEPPVTRGNDTNNHRLAANSLHVTALSGRGWIV